MTLKDKIREMLEGDPVERVAKKFEDVARRTQEIGEHLQKSIASADEALKDGDLEIAAIKFAECSILVAEWAEIRRVLQSVTPIVENFEKLQIRN